METLELVTEKAVELLSLSLKNLCVSQSEESLEQSSLCCSPHPAQCLEMRKNHATKTQTLSVLQVISYSWLQSPHSYLASLAASFVLDCYPILLSLNDDMDLALLWIVHNNSTLVWSVSRPILVVPLAIVFWTSSIVPRGFLGFHQDTWRSPWSIKLFSFPLIVKTDLELSWPEDGN